MIILNIARIRTKKQTLGLLSVSVDKFNIFFARTLELQYHDNKQNISCIPVGTYNVVKRYSAKYGHHLHILDVPDRSYILIHPANFVRQLKGCIAVGEKHFDIDGDGLKDVSNSRKTMNKLMAILPDTFKLNIFYI